LSRTAASPFSNSSAGVTKRLCAGAKKVRRSPTGSTSGANCGVRTRSTLKGRTLNRPKRSTSLGDFRYSSSRPMKKLT
jgi:hypothetical protein